MANSTAAAADTGLAEKPSLTLTRRLRAKPEKVYAAWTNPENLAQWFGPSVVTPGTTRAELDVRVGGRYRISFEATDGEHFQVDGIYREIVPNERLVFSWAWHSTPERESLVTVSLKPDGDGTLLTLLHEQLFDQAACDGHARGWNSSLDTLEKYLA
jgi:uncharacterized protein YndB with AHSA1/START domain